MMDFISWFSNVELGFHILDKFRLIVVYNSFYTLLEMFTLKNLLYFQSG